MKKSVILVNNFSFSSASQREIALIQIIVSLMFKFVNKEAHTKTGRVPYSLGLVISSLYFLFH